MSASYDQVSPTTAGHAMHQWVYALVIASHTLVNRAVHMHVVSTCSTWRLALPSLIHD